MKWADRARAHIQGLEAASNNSPDVMPANAGIHFFGVTPDLVDGTRLTGHGPEDGHVVFTGA